MRTDPAGNGAHGTRFDGALPEDASVVNLDDLHDSRSVAVLLVPPCSTVLAVGLVDNAVARTLGARLCRVWAFANDADAAQEAAPWCEGILHGDVETADLEHTLSGESSDAVLFLDGLDRFREPVATLRRVVPLLAPGGRVVLVIANIAAAPPDASPYDVLRQAGLRVIDDIRLAPWPRGSDTDPFMPSSSPGAFENEGTDPVADVSHLVLTAAPAAVPCSDGMPTLATTALAHVYRVEQRYRRLHAHARGLERQVASDDRERRELREALDEARDWHRRSIESGVTVEDAWRRSEIERLRAEEQLAATTGALEQCQLERRFLQNDVAVKDAYVAALREESAVHQQALQRQELARHEQETRHQQSEGERETDRQRRAQEHAALRRQWEEEMRILTHRLDEGMAARRLEADRAGELERLNETLRQQLAAAETELQRMHTAIAVTLAQPRYVVADRLNAWVKKLGILHSPLKRAWLARHRA